MCALGNTCCCVIATAVLMCHCGQKYIGVCVCAVGSVAVCAVCADSVSKCGLQTYQALHSDADLFSVS